MYMMEGKDRKRLKESAESGVPYIFNTWEQEGWVEPIEDRYGDASRTS